MTWFGSLRVSRVPLAAFACVGIFWGSFAASLPEFKQRLALTDAALGLILLASAAGALVAMALAPRVEAVLPRWGLTLAGFAMGAAVLPLGLSGSSLGFTVVLILIGTTTGLYDILGNARVSLLEARHRMSLMNFNHAVYSLSYAAAAYLTGIARELSVDPASWFALVGVAVGAITVLTLSRNGAAAIGAETPQASGGAVGVFAWLAGLVVLIGFFAENATEGWSALHIERTLGGGAIEGALGPTMLGLTMGIGRLMGHVITMRGTELSVLHWSAILAAAGLVIAASAPAPIVAYLGFALLGLGVSVVGPLALALAGQQALPERRTLAVSRAAMVGYFGFFIGPPLMGFLSEAFGLRLAFGVGGALLLVIPLILVPQLRRRAIR